MAIRTSRRSSRGWRVDRFGAKRPREVPFIGGLSGYPLPDEGDEPSQRVPRPASTASPSAPADPARSGSDHLQSHSKASLARPACCQTGRRVMWCMRGHPYAAAGAAPGSPRSCRSSLLVAQHATSCHATPGLQPGSPRRLRRRMTAMSMTATAASTTSTTTKPIGALIKYAQIAPAVKPNTASHSHNVRALMAGAAPPIPDVGS
jgi:hypothetical protein